MPIIRNKKKRHREFNKERRKIEKINPILKIEINTFEELRKFLKPQFIIYREKKTIDVK